MVPNLPPQDVVVHDPDDPPPPLDELSAIGGLTVPEIALRNQHSKVAIYGAVKRLKIEHFLFKGGIRLYSPAQADFLARHMRNPQNRSGKRSGAASCPQS